MIYESDFSLSTWYRPTAGSPYVGESLLVSPYPPPPDLFVNKVWDPIDGDYVRWETAYRDTQGAEYPGSSAWSAVAASYCIESITFRRLES
jgi:hypothetical protein